VTVHGLEKTSRRGAEEGRRVHTEARRSRRTRRKGEEFTRRHGDHGGRGGRARKGDCHLFNGKVQKTDRKNSSALFI